jgi:hypothetical protein
MGWRGKQAGADSLGGDDHYYCGGEPGGAGAGVIEAVDSGQISVVSSSYGLIGWSEEM